MEDIYINFKMKESINRVEWGNEHPIHVVRKTFAIYKYLTPILLHYI